MAAWTSVLGTQKREDSECRHSCGDEDATHGRANAQKYHAQYQADSGQGQDRSAVESE